MKPSEQLALITDALTKVRALSWLQFNDRQTFTYHAAENALMALKCEFERLI